MARWMSVARNDFYDEVEKIVGAIHSTKISGNFGQKVNGSVWSNRKSFEKTGPPFEVNHFSPLDQSDRKLTVPFDNSDPFSIPVPRCSVFSLQHGGKCRKHFSWHLHFYLSVQPLQMVDNGFVGATCSPVRSFNRYVVFLQTKCLFWLFSSTCKNPAIFILRFN